MREIGPGGRYQRRGTRGTIVLGESADIFEAGELLTTARRAVSDPKAAEVYVDLALTERIDLSAIQILLALRADLVAVGRGFAAINASNKLRKRLERAALPLLNN